MYLLCNFYNAGFTQNPHDVLKQGLPEIFRNLLNLKMQLRMKEKNFRVK